MLPQERVASARIRENLAADDEAAREEEAGASHTIHQLHDPRGLQRWERQEQEEGRDELGPHEERKSHEREPRGAELDRGRDEVDRSEQRRGDQEDHPDQPHRLTRARQDGQGRIGRPPGLRGSPGDEKAGEHRHAAEEEEPVARHVEPRERHVGGSNLEREHEVPESSDGEGDHPEEHHDGAVHRTELVVELRQHRPARHAPLAEQVADQRQRRARVGELPAHEHHQRKAEEQEQEPRDGVLDADDLVVGGKDVLAPEAQLLVMGFVRDVRPGCDDASLLTHCGLSPDRYFAAGTANLMFWVFVSLAPTVIEAVCVPSFSCQAVISYVPGSRPEIANFPSVLVTEKKGWVKTAM